jgi:hypothetical protein
MNNHIDDIKIKPNAGDNAEKDMRVAYVKDGVARASEKEREKVEDLYFKFKSEEERDRAIKIINQKRTERHEFDDNFRFFLKCKTNPENPLQIDMEFSKNNKDTHAYFHKLLEENNLTPTAEYETANKEPVPDHTVINGK